MNGKIVTAVELTALKRLLNTPPKTEISIMTRTNRISPDQTYEIEIKQTAVTPDMKGIGTESVTLSAPIFKRGHFPPLSDCVILEQFQIIKTDHPETYGSICMLNELNLLFLRRKEGDTSEALANRIDDLTDRLLYCYYPPDKNDWMELWLETICPYIRKEIKFTS